MSPENESKNPGTGPQGPLKRLCGALCRPSARFTLLTLLGVGFVAGIIFWGGFNTFMEFTNTMTFCTSCHEMKSTVYEEYKKTPHYQNASGVRAICSDCHVPKPWPAKLARKMRATNELFHWLAGTVDTPEKFEAKRRELAEHVWTTMKATDSRECRNCHSFTSMELAKQRPRARGKHEGAIAKNETCIDCHKGIAHKHVHKEEENKGTMEAAPSDEEGFTL